MIDLLSFFTVLVFEGLLIRTAFMCLNTAFLGLSVAFLSLSIHFLNLLFALKNLFVIFLRLTVLFFDEVIHPFFVFRRLYATLDAYSNIVPDLSSPRIYEL